MNKEDINLLVEQIRHIILNKPLNEELKSKSEELAELQESIVYLSNCLTEYNEFLKHLQAGELDVKPPDRHNFLAGNLKELHSALKHLTWKANRVANGDYSQKVDFMGDFSDSFNSMIFQLAERESKLKHQSVVLAEMLELTKSIVDGLNDWIVITDNESGEIIYTNQSANQLFYDMDTGKYICGQSCELMEQLKKYREQDNKGLIFDYTCPLSMKTLCAKSFAIQWNNKTVYVHYIKDNTIEQNYYEQVEEMAYTDELTGLYNRRYLMKQLENQLLQKNEFSFCMIDLDDLKYANDNFGHSAGDQYLKIVADEMTKITRATDIVCRIGGDEFAILFPNCTSVIAINKMNRANKIIESFSDGFSMSISYGVIHVEAGMEILPEKIIILADEKMYTLKSIKKAVKRNPKGLLMTFTWTKELETGNAQIDAEHKELMQAINNLLAACAAGKGISELSHTMDFLNRYIKTHFEYEEALQLKYGYPGYENHKKYHEEFVKVVNDISIRLKSEGTSVQLVDEINQQLAVWLINHIKTDDVKMAKYVLSQNK